MLNHITQTTAGRNKYEGFQTDTFRLGFIFPTTIAEQPLITEHVLSVSGWAIPEIEILEQEQGASRLFASNTLKTRQDLAIALTLNFDEQSSLYIYESLKAIHHLTSNPFTYTKSLKKDYMFDVQVEYFLRNGQKVYDRIAKNCILNGTFADGVFDADITDSELKQLEMNISAEYYTEVAI
jgi:gamma-glutamylcyclotransferase (GGCT)/AIG2-like uncharacterized protein YtfP